MMINTFLYKFFICLILLLYYINSKYENKILLNNILILIYNLYNNYVGDYKNINLLYIIKNRY